MELTVGSIVEGKVSGIADFGAFIRLEGGKTGLVHISEVALTYVKNINEHLKVNDTVKAKVMSVDANGKISLSIKKALEQEQKSTPRTVKAPAPVEFSSPSNNASLSFEDKMKQFMLDSDERMVALKRNMDSKRRSNRKSHA